MGLHQNKGEEIELNYSSGLKKERKKVCSGETESAVDSACIIHLSKLMCFSRRAQNIFLL